jgi:sensor histidine kinase YesM
VLIGEDPRQAERFVDEMAKVYRYLLQAHRSSQQPAQAGLTTLEAEVRFIESYAYLLRTRYGAALDLRVVPAEASPSGGLLPLTLQTLVDNAIRHNVVSAARPLRIEIHASPGHVRVQNSLQKRSVRVPMAREGLSGLQARYQLLQPAKSLVVDANEDYFSVSVPLASA